MHVCTEICLYIFMYLFIFHIHMQCYILKIILHMHVFFDSTKYKMKVYMEEVFEPAYPPLLGYNSKKITGMVGLENLGATCYLNALLQVSIYINNYTDIICFIFVLIYAYYFNSPLHISL